MSTARSKTTARPIGKDVTGNSTKLDGYVWVCSSEGGTSFLAANQDHIALEAKIRNKEFPEEITEFGRFAICEKNHDNEEDEEMNEGHSKELEIPAEESKSYSSIIKSITTTEKISWFPQATKLILSWRSKTKEMTIV